MISTTVTGALIVALVGWFATILVISRSSLSRGQKRFWMIPSWIPWLALALGAPILSGMLPLPQAINIGGGMTAGMVVSLVIARRQPPQR